MRKSHVLILAVVFALAAAACSSNTESEQVATLESGTDSTVQGADDTGSDPIVETKEAMLAFTQCLRDQSMDIADPTVDADGNVQLGSIMFDSGSGVADPEEHMGAMDDALAACDEHMQGVAAAPGVSDFTEFEDNLLADTQCMRDNGIDMPDPDFSGEAGVVELGALDTEEFEAADAECRHHMAFLDG